MFTCHFIAIAMLGLLPGTTLVAEDLTVADFEGADFGEWKVSGEAFGNGPAQGSIEGQMQVDGFQGKGFLNGYHGHDDAIAVVHVLPPGSVKPELGAPHRGSAQTSADSARWRQTRNRLR